MKLLLFTDHHGSPTDLAEVKKKVREADLVICAGDFTIFESDIEYIMEYMDSFGKEMLLIHGNHEDEDVTGFLCRQTKNIKFLHALVIIKEEYAFVGWGGGGFATDDPEFEAWAHDISPSLKDKKIIFVTHGPPHGTKIDKLSAGYVGNKSYTKFIKQYKPVLAVAGHLHELFGKKDKIGKTIVINPGPTGSILEV